MRSKLRVLVRYIVRKNKKVRNATPTEIDGIKFRSKLEAYTYTLLKKNKINAEYEKHKYELIPAFTYMGEKIRAITYTPDFVGDTFIIECKGFPNETFPIKWKLFKFILNQKNDQTKHLYIVHSQKEVQSVVDQLLTNT